MFSVPSKPGENLGKMFVRILEQLKTLDCIIGFSLIYFQILQNIYLSFHQAI